MTNTSPHHQPLPAPMYVRVSPQVPVAYAPAGTVPLVPSLLPDGRVVYTASNPSTPSGAVVVPAVGPPPLSIATSAVAFTAAPVAHPAPPKTESCPPCPPPKAEYAYCKPAESAGSKADCEACKAAERAACTVPGCTTCAAPPAAPAPAPGSHSWVVATATRSEAEHWVSRILKYSLDYLRTLKPQDFQLLIDSALHKAQEKPDVKPDIMVAGCPSYLEHRPRVACDPRMHAANRRATENWLHRTLDIPRPILQCSTAQQLDALITAALAKIRQ